MIVIAILIDCGLVCFATYFAVCVFTPELPDVLALSNIFINSYCKVVKLSFDLAYKYVSNQLFHCPTARNKEIVAITGNDKGIMIRTKIVKSLAPSILADSSNATGKLSINERITITLKALSSIGRI